MARTYMSPEQKEKMFAMDRAGKTDREIADALKMKYDTIRQALSRARKRGDLPPAGKRGPKPKPAEETVYKEKRTVVFLDEKTRRLLRLASLVRGESMSVIVREALKRYLGPLAKKHRLD